MNYLIAHWFHIHCNSMILYGKHLYICSHPLKSTSRNPPKHEATQSLHHIGNGSDIDTYWKFAFAFSGHPRSDTHRFYFEIDAQWRKFDRERKSRGRKVEPSADRSSFYCDVVALPNRWRKLWKCRQMLRVHVSIECVCNWKVA